MQFFSASRARYRSPRARGEPVGVTTGRLEAFSDGVIAVVITLLVLNIHVPVPPLARGKTLVGERLPGPQWRGGDMDVQHEQRDRHRDHSVGESLEPARAHADRFAVASGAPVEPP